LASDVAIIGLGYVGLPLAQEASRSGLTVLGYDVSQRVVDGLNSGRSHVDDLSDADISEMTAAGFEATTDAARIGEVKTIVICVPTPLAEDGGPDLGPINSAVATIAEHLQPGPHRRRPRLPAEGHRCAGGQLVGLGPQVHVLGEVQDRPHQHQPHREPRRLPPGPRPVARSWCSVPGRCCWPGTGWRTPRSRRRWARQ
jgi:hypothetical protein